MIRRPAKGLVRTPCPAVLSVNPAAIRIRTPHRDLIRIRPERITVAVDLDPFTIRIEWLLEELHRVCPTRILSLALFRFGRAPRGFLLCSPAFRCHACIAIGSGSGLLIRLPLRPTLRSP